MKDLLAAKAKAGAAAAPLKIRQTGKAGTVVEGLSRHPVHSMESALKLIKKCGPWPPLLPSDL